MGEGPIITGVALAASTMLLWLVSREWWTRRRLRQRIDAADSRGAASEPAPPEVEHLAANWSVPRRHRVPDVPGGAWLSTLMVRGGRATRTHPRLTSLATAAALVVIAAAVFAPLLTAGGDRSPRMPQAEGAEMPQARSTSDLPAADGPESQVGGARPAEPSQAPTDPDTAGQGREPADTASDAEQPPAGAEDPPATDPDPPQDGGGPGDPPPPADAPSPPPVDAPPGDDEERDCLLLLELGIIADLEVCLGG